MNWLFETLWLNKGVNIGLKKYYDVVKMTCEEQEGVEFLGLYSPKNEPWNWAYIFFGEQLETGSEVNNKIAKKYGGINGNIVNSVTRIYWRYDPPSHIPKLNRIELTNHLIIEHYNIDGIDSGIKEINESFINLCDGKDGLEFLGIYAPWSEGWNWSQVFVTDSLKKYMDIQAEFYRSFGRPENVTASIARFYERTAF